MVNPTVANPHASAECRVGSFDSCTATNSIAIRSRRCSRAATTAAIIRAPSPPALPLKGAHN